MTSFKNHRIVIDSYEKSSTAYEWCVENIPWSDWIVETGNNDESFYIDYEKHAQNFLFLFGGRYYNGG